MATYLIDIRRETSPRVLNRMKFQLRAGRKSAVENGIDAEGEALWQERQDAVDARLTKFVPVLRKDHAPVPTGFLRCLVTIAPRGAQQEARPYIHKTCMVDKDTTLTYDGYQLYGEDLSVFAAAVCFRQLDLAHFDALIWPTPRSIDRRSVKLVSAAVSD